MRQTAAAFGCGRRLGHLEKEQIQLTIGSPEINVVRKVLVDPDLPVSEFLEEAARKWKLKVPCVLMDLDGNVLDGTGTFEENRVLEGDWLYMGPDFLSDDLSAWHTKFSLQKPEALH